VWGQLGFLHPSLQRKGVFGGEVGGGGETG